MFVIVLVELESILERVIVAHIRYLYVHEIIFITIIGMNSVKDWKSFQE